MTTTEARTDRHRTLLDAADSIAPAVTALVPPQSRDDVTQGFLLWALESGSLDRFDAERGSFQAFVGILLRRYVLKRIRKYGQKKRGGDHVTLSLTEPGDGPASADAEPWVAIDRRELVTAVTTSLTDERSRLAERGRDWCIDAFLEHDLAESEDRLTYRELAVRHGVAESAVRNGLYGVRNALRKRLRRRLGIDGAAAAC